MPYILMIEGQEIPIAEEVAANDQILRDAITPFYPEIANAEITREEKNGITQIRMVKKAGTKGVGDILQTLIDSEHQFNPALILSWQIKMLEIQGCLNIENLILVQDELEKAITTGREWQIELEKSLHLLQQFPPIPSQKIITGF
ncbi:hypothetical protein Cylst_6373 (plasmid) [Cylindrospermum stagnale PCC 7417]|uniref:Uncharacterized protein n=1 Tax=Cylindrospermum stagnale PCC 7417 TaxID=56107 RepID=K9XAE7_9NOST|nr:hypothetical protein [Cylindrospermum stagnale]AFZ28592.1 hypothetical protein Cylst_6373 [Cylindrospermum stagnale PCC 7417]